MGFKEQLEAFRGGSVRKLKDVTLQWGRDGGLDSPNTRLTFFFKEKPTDLPELLFIQTALKQGCLLYLDGPNYQPMVLITQELFQSWLT